MSKSANTNRDCEGDRDPTAHLDRIEQRAHDALVDPLQCHLSDLDRVGAAIGVREGPR